jgi:hypothetical protein
MRKQTGFLIVAALVLAAAYAFFFTDWFGQKSIHILFRMRGRQPIFGLEGREYRLTTVKVVRADDATTNKYPHALWHLVADEKGSEPVTDFVYGETLKGMKPKVPGTAPEAVQPNTNYRLILEAGKIKGEREFQISGK